LLVFIKFAQIKVLKKQGVKKNRPGMELPSRQKE